MEHPACHPESLVPEVDDVTGEKFDKGDSDNCVCIIVLVSLQKNTVFPAALLPPAPDSALEVALGCRASAISYKNTRVYGDYPLIIAINAGVRQLTVQPNATPS